MGNCIQIFWTATSFRSFKKVGAPTPFGKKQDLSAAPSAISGLYLNLQFKNKILLCTTGTAFNTFIPDKRLEQLWDGMVLDFFSQHQIIFEEM